ncbi:terminase small subunit [Gordonia phage Howe]|uniref:Terminase small subunit n=1 Tax=Gordonia phage Howe TaxID=1777061 RepID=A0A0U4K3Z3_9CAUD|nr:terminase small subunit [Gordonia phage Howe]AZF93191.1 terminase small subunit [Gordonia phage Adora]QDF16784.1 terminase small subunit [Gordonia phage Twinkle]QYC54402.1 terminase small subunit [Gordonia phage Shlim410]UAJ16253.1 terminase small subunit [Gordonia phage Hortense]ALY07635.1 terminase small subunit [Gordonia phage Howe]
MYESAFGDAGSALWADLAAESDPFSLLVLIIEACRLADRLAKFDELLRGDIDTWARLTHRTLTDDYELKIDSASAEARQTAGALRQILAEVRRLKSEQDDPGDGNPLDDL